MAESVAPERYVHKIHLSELITRMELLIERMEVLSSPPPKDVEAEEAAEKYIKRRKLELMGGGVHVEPAD